MDDLSRHYFHIALADIVLAKAVGIGPLTVMARLEKRLGEFIYSAWDRRSIQALVKAKAVLKKPLSAKKIESVVGDEMGKWQSDIRDIYVAEFRKTYSLGKQAAWKVLTGQSKATLTYFGPDIRMEPVEKASKRKYALEPSFTVADEKAIAALEAHQLFWIGEYYDSAVSESIGLLAKEVVIESGENMATAALLLEEKLKVALAHVALPSGYAGTTKQYFQGVVANAVTVARVAGQLSSFTEVGVATYRINAIGDSRTCERCSYMDGTSFSVEQGSKQLSSLLKADTPEQIKKIHPWLSLKELQSISPSPGSKGTKGDALAASGQSLPPFHFKCRCTIDVDYSSYSYNDLE